MTQAIAKLNDEQQQRFDALEAVCANGRVVFFMVGMALDEIKAQKYYEAKGFADFGAYCESIGFTRRHCNQMIIDAKVVAELPENLRALVTSARAAKELGNIPKQLRLAVVVEATKGGEKKITAGDVRKASPASTPPPRKPKPSSTPPPRRGGGKPAAKPAEKLPKDSTGVEIPREIVVAYNRGHEAVELLTYLSSVRSALKKARDESDKLFTEVDFTDCIAKLDQVHADVSRAKPYAVCPTCAGKIVEGCLSCKDRGFVSEFYWKTFVPEEIRKLRGAK